MYSRILLSALLTAASHAFPQGEGEGYPPPPPQVLSTTLSGVLPVLPTVTPGPFAGVETEEGAIIDDGPANPSFMPVNGPATTAAGLPAATYEAVLPSTNWKRVDNGTGSTIMGSITISSVSDGSGVSVSVNFTGFPSESEYGPFVYHIHEYPVPANGNCTATVGHLDPTDRGEYYPCNVAAPDTCQVGDLAGKHGNITMTDFVAMYSDSFLSTDPSSPAFFGDKSVVIHSTNATRLTCANFMMVTAAVNGTGGVNASMTSGMPSPTQSVTPYTGAASMASVGYGALGVLAAAAAFVL